MRTSPALLMLVCACRPTADSADSPVSDTGEPLLMLEDLELGDHPRTVVGSEDRAALLERVATGGGDTLTDQHAALWSAIQADCDAALPSVELNPIDLGGAWTAAAQARNCAFVAWLEQDAERGAKAATILEGLAWDAHDIDDVTMEIHLSTALAAGAQAWDLLAGSGLELELDAAEQAVLTQATGLWEAYVEDWPMLYQAWQNNHNVKTATALGLAALALDAEPDQRLAWLGYAQTELQHIQLGVQATDSGAGYGEGPGYHAYAALTSQPFMLAYHRSFPDESYRWPVTCSTRPDGSCDGADSEVVGDLQLDQRILEQLRWNAKLRMPDGARPPFDDSRRVGFPSGMMAALDASLAWDWLQTDSSYHSWSGDVNVETLVLLDDVGEPPTHDPCWRSPETGVAVLASSHDTDATWAMLLAEPVGPMTSWGHEHADAGTIQLYAHGSYLVLDPGYAGWTLREETDDYEHHAGILLDGSGPPSGVSGELEVLWDTASTGCEAAVELGWEGSTWRRGISLAQDALVVRDTLALSGAQTLQWRLPTMSGQGRGELELRDWGAMLHQDATSLAVVVQSDATITLALELGPDAATYGSVVEHQVLTVTTDAVEEAWFFAVLLPLEAGAEPDVSGDAEGIDIDGVRWTR